MSGAGTSTARRRTLQGAVAAARRRGAPAGGLLACLVVATLWGCARAPSPAASPTPGPATGPIDSRRALPSPLPRIAASVNGQPILIERVALLARAAQAKAEDRSVPDPGALRGALQQLIVRELLVQEALVRGLQADARVVERAYDAQRGRQGSATEWHVFLAQQGLSDDDFRAELRVQATVDALRRQIADEIDPESFPEDEVRAFYQAHPELSGPQPPRPYEEIAERARMLLAKVRAAERRGARGKRLEARARIEIFI